MAISRWLFGNLRDLVRYRFTAFTAPCDRLTKPGSEDQTAKVWEPTTGRELATLAGHSARVFSVAFSPDGRRIVTGGTHGLAKVWEMRPDVARDQVPRELLSLKGHTASINAVALSHDGQSISTGGVDQTVKVWEAASPQQLAAWRNEEATDAQYLESVETQRNGGGRRSNRRARVEAILTQLGYKEGTMRARIEKLNATLNPTAEPDPRLMLVAKVEALVHDAERGRGQEGGRLEL